MVTTHPSVGVVIYHKEDNALLIVRQFRPPVFVALQQEVQLLVSLRAASVCRQ